MVRITLQKLSPKFATTAQNTQSEVQIEKRNLECEGFALRPGQIKPNRRQQQAKTKKLAHA
jgi:hypothetical protein